MKQLTLKIKGMTCASCVRRVETGLEIIKGVREANVNLSTEKATINYDESTIKAEQIIASIEKWVIRLTHHKLRKRHYPLAV
ncbi:hypothetical protein N752_23875 [Desulforamulus aquiferis]|nr:hypothetical protein N752_23875 [Desulforamulus aquiferis]